jgi:hypothetical protein
MERFVVPDALAHDMCNRLGVGLPSSRAEVGELYRAWCEQVPFDSISKALARRTGGVPPGADPVEFCEQWLATSLGGTCWGHVAALAAVLGAAGFDCRVGLDHLLGVERVDFHAFVVLDDGGPLWALDPIHGSGRPLPIKAGAQGQHPAYPVHFEADGRRLLHCYQSMHDGGFEPRTYALLSTDLDAAAVRTFCEVARMHGMRAVSIYVRRFTATEMIDSRPSDDGTTLVVRHISATTTSEIRYTDPERAFAALGYGPLAVAVAERAGLIERSGGGAVRFVPRPLD